MAAARYIVLERMRRGLRRERVFKDRTNPLEVLSEDEIHQRYRFFPQTIIYIVDLVTPALQHPTKRNLALPVLLQVLTALRFLACGAFNIVIADTLNVSKTTVWSCVKRFCRAMVALMPQFVIFPGGPQRKCSRAVKEDFFNIAGFPNVLGAVDGTHVRICSPHHLVERHYVNRKGYHSINIQLVCNAEFYVTNIVAKWAGSTHDSRMFRTCALREQFEQGLHDGVLLGDSGYALEPYLLTPFINPETEPRKRFNYAHIRSRVIIEQTNGILKMRFPCMRDLRVQPEMAIDVSVTCAVLHNIALLQAEGIWQGDGEEDNIPLPPPRPAADLRNRRGAMARDMIVQNYFS